jgi:hypothetical protein
MSFWKKLFGARRGDGGLASRLASDHEATFIAALQEAVRYAPEGSDVGLRAMEEAMRRRSGNKSLSFMANKLGSLTLRLGDEIFDAPNQILKLAKNRDLLRAPAKSQDLMSACFAGDIQGARKLAIRCGELGGDGQLFAFQLLYNHMIGTVKLDRARGKKGLFEDGEDTAHRESKQVSTAAGPQFPPILEATGKGDIEKVKALLKDDPRLASFAYESSRWTPLHAAAQNGHESVAELLLANKADVNAKDNQGKTPLWIAVWCREKSLVELLLKHGAENTKDDEGVTPLHLAVAPRTNKGVAELLLASNFDVDSTDDSGSTPLHYAANRGLMEMVELLLANKADVNAKDKEGQTPLRYATAEGHTNVAELLLANKAETR